MKVLVAPDKFKGSLTAEQAARAIVRGVRRAAPDAETVVIPMADGGEGTLDAIKKCVPGEFVRVGVVDPLGRPVRAKYLVVSRADLPAAARRRLKGCGSRIAFIEMAQAGGYLLLSENERNPELTSTFGVGMMIDHAIARGVDSVVVTVGGSATNDGGIGMATALGYRFLDERGRSVKPVGRNMAKVRRIVRPDADGDRGDAGASTSTRSDSTIKTKTPVQDDVKFFVAADVENPFHGKHGAAHVFAPQKGADHRMVERLDKGLRNLARAVRRDLGVDLQKLPGSGAAGGLGGGAMAFLGAEMVPGSALMAEIADVKTKSFGADLCIVAEGRFDLQSLKGKAPIGIAEAVQPVPVIVLAGSVDQSAQAAVRRGSLPVTAAFSITNGPMTFDEAKADVQELLASTAQSVVQIFLARK